MQDISWWCNNHLEKYQFVNGKDDIPYMKWKIKFMFETTNQTMQLDDLEDFYSVLESYLIDSSTT